MFDVLLAQFGRNVVLPVSKMISLGTPPAVHLGPIRVSTPSRGVIIAAFLALYFIIIAGFVYGAIKPVPFIGYERNERGQMVTRLIADRMTGQFGLEATLAGIAFLAAFGGMILVAKNINNNESKHATLFSGVGLGVVVMAYFIILSMVRVKMPGYYP